MINGLIDLLCQGEGAVLLIDGPVASGKTEIIQAVAHRAMSAGAQVLTATASVLERDFPLGVVAQLIEDVPEDGNPRSSGMVSVVKALRGLAQAQENYPMNLMIDVYDQLTEIAKKSPVIVIVDDLHHSDSVSLSLILGLARRAQRRPMLFVLSQQCAPACEVTNFSKPSCAVSRTVTTCSSSRSRLRLSAKCWRSTWAVSRRCGSRRYTPR